MMRIEYDWQQSIPIRPITADTSGLGGEIVESFRVPSKAPPRRGVGLGRIIATPIRAGFRLLTESLPSALGHLSTGDVDAAKRVPGLFTQFRRAWQDSGSLWTEAQRGLTAAASVWGGALTVTEGLGRIAGRLSAGDTEGAWNEAGRTFYRLGRARTGGQVVEEWVKTHLPYFISGVSNIVYTDERGRTGVARIANLHAMDWMEDAERKGWKVNDVFVAPPSKSAALVGNALAFAADIVDPFIAGAFGGAMRTFTRAVRTPARLKPVVAAANRIGELASKISAPGTVIGNVIDDMERWGGALRRSTVSLQDRIYRMRGGRLESEALRAQLSFQSNELASVLKGTNRSVIKHAEAFLRETDEARKTAHGMHLLSRGIVGPGGDVEQAAQTVIKISSMSPEERTALNQLALAWREGDTTIESIIKRVSRSKRAGSAPAEVQRAYRSIAAVERAAAKAGIEMADIETVANVYTLPRAGLNVPTADVQNALVDFERVLDMRARIPAALQPSRSEISSILSSAPIYASLKPAAQRRVAAGLKAIQKAEMGGASAELIDQMNRALAVSMTKGGDEWANLVERYLNADRVIRAHLAPGPGVKPETARRVFAMRKAVEKEAAAQGIDLEVLREAVRLVDTYDEQIGRMLTSTGVITPEQFTRMRGIHTRRTYAALESGGWLEQKIAEIAREDPITAATLEQQRIRLLQSKSTIENLWLSVPPGAASRRLGKSRKAISKEFRSLLGQLDNLSDVIRLAGERAAKDISNHTFYRAIRSSGLASDTPRPTEGLTARIPTGPNWGALSGKWVSPKLKEMLIRYAREFTERPGIIETIWRRHIMGRIKQALVVFNPVAIRNNMVGNLIAQIGATGETNIVELARYHWAAIQSLRNWDTFAARLARFSPSLRKSSIRSELEMGRLFRPVEETPEAAALKRPWLFFRQLGRRIARAVYENPEAEGKMMIFHYAIDKLKMTDMDAALLAEKWMIDYNNVPPIIEALRSRIGIMPFVTYSYKMAGNLARFPFARPETLARMSKPMLGLMDAIPQDVREAEKTGIPPWAQDNLLLRLPGPDARYINLEPYLPWSIFNTQETPQAPPVISEIISAIGPPYITILELGFNRKRLTGEAIVPEGIDPDTAARLRWQYLSEQVPQSRLLKQLFASVKGISLKETQRPSKWYDMFLSIYNWKIEKIAALNYQRKQNELRKIVNMAGRIRNSTTLDEDAKAERVTRLLREADAVEEQMREINRNMVRIEGLRELLATSGLDAEKLEMAEQWFVDQPPATPEDIRRMQAGASPPTAPPAPAPTAPAAGPALAPVSAGVRSPWPPSGLGGVSPRAIRAERRLEEAANELHYNPPGLPRAIGEQPARPRGGERPVGFRPQGGF